MLPPLDAFLSELHFQTSRSSGPGGQNVNKVESRVELRFHLANSQVLSEEQKTLLLEKLGSRLTSDGYLLVVAQEDRSQLRNRELVQQKFYELMTRALQRPKARKPTRPSKAAERRRIDAKKRLGQKKADRRGDF